MKLIHTAGYIVSGAILFVLHWPALAVEDESWQKMIAAGDKYTTLQKLLPAEEMYRSALTQVEKTHRGAEDISVCLERLASACALENKADEAIPLYRRSLSILEQKYGKDSPKIVSTLVALGSILESEGDHDPAMKLYSRALSINEKNYGSFSPAVAGSLQQLGRAAFKAGKTEDAEHHYKQSLAILMKNPDLRASHQLESLLGDYADLLRRKDGSENDLIREFKTRFPLPDKEPINTQSVRPVDPNLPQSAWQERLLQQSTLLGARQENEERKVMSRALVEPLSSSSLSPAYRQMADVYNGQHAYKDEEDRYQRMVAIDIKALGPDHPTVADDLYGLSLLYVSQGRFADAKPLLARALNIYQTVYGEGSLLVKNAQSTLASIDAKMGNALQASALIRGDLSNGSLAVNPNDLDTAKRLNELGYIYFRQGRLDDACTIYQWALSSTEAASGKDSPAVAACLKDYAEVLKSMGRTNEAEQMQLRATLISAKTTPALR